MRCLGLYGCASPSDSAILPAGLDTAGRWRELLVLAPPQPDPVNRTFLFGAKPINYLGSGQKNWDASVFKTVTIKEEYLAQFRAEALNIFNSPLLANPNPQFGSPVFWKISYQANEATATRHTPVF